MNRTFSRLAQVPKNLSIQLSPVAHNANAMKNYPLVGPDHAPEENLEKVQPTNKAVVLYKHRPNAVAVPEDSIPPAEYKDVHSASPTTWNKMAHSIGGANPEHLKNPMLTNFALSVMEALTGRLVDEDPVAADVAALHTLYSGNPHKPALEGDLIQNSPQPQIEDKTALRPTTIDTEYEETESYVSK